MQLAASPLGDGGIDMALENGARVFVEHYNPDLLHTALEDGEVATTEDGWRLIRQGNEVVCIVPRGAR
jgi:hypothetical protein